MLWLVCLQLAAHLIRHEKTCEFCIIGYQTLYGIRVLRNDRSIRTLRKKYAYKYSFLANLFASQLATTDWGACCFVQSFYTKLEICASSLCTGRTQILRMSQPIPTLTTRLLAPFHSREIITLNFIFSMHMHRSTCIVSWET